MVTKEQVEKAKAVYAEAEAEADALAVDVEAAENNVNAAWNKYCKLKREFETKMVTKEDVDKAAAYAVEADDKFAEAEDDAHAAWTKYWELRREFENKSGESDGN